MGTRPFKPRRDPNRDAQLRDRDTEHFVRDVTLVGLETGQRPHRWYSECCKMHDWCRSVVNNCRARFADGWHDISNRQSCVGAVVQKAEGGRLQPDVQGWREGRPYADNPMGSERHPRQPVQNTHRLASTDTIQLISLVRTSPTTLTIFICNDFTAVVCKNLTDTSQIWNLNYRGYATMRGWTESVKICSRCIECIVFSRFYGLQCSAQKHPRFNG